MVADIVSTTLATLLALLSGWKLGPPLGRWSTTHRLARFVVGLLTELRMLPVLVALIPLSETRLGLPAFAVVGLLSGASRMAAVARFVAHTESAEQPAAGWMRRRLPRRFYQLDVADGGARTVLLLTVPEVALLEGLSTFFSQGRGVGLGAALAQGHLASMLPLLLLAGAAIVSVEGPALRPWRRTARSGPPA